MGILFRTLSRRCNQRFVSTLHATMIKIILLHPVFQGWGDVRFPGKIKLLGNVFRAHKTTIPIWNHCDSLLLTLKVEQPTTCFTFIISATYMFISLMLILQLPYKTYHSKLECFAVQHTKHHMTWRDWNWKDVWHSTIKYRNQWLYFCPGWCCYEVRLGKGSPRFQK